MPREQTDIAKKYQKLQQQKENINLISKLKENNDYYNGDFFKNVNLSQLPQIDINFTKTYTDFPVAQVMSQKVDFVFSAKDSIEDLEGDKTNDDLLKTASNYNVLAEKLQEHLKQNKLNRKVLKKAAKSGLGGILFYWDNDYKGGNRSKIVGEVSAELFDASSILFGDPTCNVISEQPYMIIPTRKMISKVKEEAKENGVSDTDIMQITPDDLNLNEFPYSQSSSEVEGEMCTVLYYIYLKEGKAFFKKSTRNVVFKDETDLDFEGYPVALCYWDDKEGSAYGKSETEKWIKTQRAYNRLMAVRMLNALLMSSPKLMLSDKVSGNLNNVVGGIIRVAGEVDVRKHAGYLQPAEPSNNSVTLPTDIIEAGRTANNVMQNVTGEGSADNASAIIAQQKQAGIARDDNKANFKDFLEQVGNIYCQFFKTKYNLAREIFNEETGEFESYTASDAKDVDFNISVDVGVTSAHSEILDLQQLTFAYQSGAITIIDYFRLLPPDISSNRNAIIKTIEDNDITGEFMQIVIERFLQQATPEEQQELQGLQPKQLENRIMEILMVEWNQEEQLNNQQQMQQEQQQVVQPLV